MSDFDPGEGWHERIGVVQQGTPFVKYDDGQGGETFWVREVPVPPLPTEPYTVIRAQYQGDERELVRRRDGSWQDVESGGTLVSPERISGFEVLAEPPLHIVFKQDEEHDAEVRRETAKAVLERIDAIDVAGDWLATIHDEDGDATVRIVAREFGVE